MEVLATGATGKFASLVVPALASHGIQVRAVVHDAGKSGIPLGHGASEVVAADLDFTILQPAMYMQGLGDAYTRARSTGSLVMPWSKHSKMTYVDYRDVAEAAALALAGDRLAMGTFELAEPGMADRAELAELMTAAAGREVTAADLPPGSGLPPGQPEGLGAMFAEYDRHGCHGEIHWCSAPSRDASRAAWPTTWASPAGWPHRPGLPRGEPPAQPDRWGEAGVLHITDIPVRPVSLRVRPGQRLRRPGGSDESGAR